MKKKVLSVLLATALFAGSAASVSAVTWGDWDSSSLAGLDEEITALTFAKESYTVRNGGDSLNLNEELTAYVGTKKVVQEPNLDWTISENNLTFGLTVTDNLAKVEAYENSGSAIVTVTANDGKVKASTTVVAAPLIKATGLKFSENTYKLVTGIDKAGNSMDDTYTVNVDVEVVATPADAIFSQAQKNALASLQLGLKYTRDVEGDAAAPDKDDIDSTILGISGDVKNGKVVFTLDRGYLATLRNNVTNAEFYLQTPNDAAGKFTLPAYDSDKSPKTGLSRTAKVSTTPVKLAERAGRTGSITVEVGQTVALNDFVKFGPSGWNVNRLEANADGTQGAKMLTEWSLDYYNEADETNDEAVLNNDQDKVMGISAPGKLKAVATYTAPDGTQSTIEIPINVVAKGSVAKNDMELSATSGTLAVGGTTWIEFKNAPSDPENITWTVDNDVVTIVPATGAGIKVFAKKTGTAKVTATYGDQTFEFTVTVNAKDAVAPVPTPGDDTVNPPTGDSLFANLF